MSYKIELQLTIYYLTYANFTQVLTEIKFIQ